MTPRVSGSSDGFSRWRLNELDGDLRAWPYSSPCDCDICPYFSITSINWLGLMNCSSLFVCLRVCEFASLKVSFWSCGPGSIGLICILQCAGMDCIVWAWKMCPGGGRGGGGGYFCLQFLIGNVNRNSDRIGNCCCCCCCCWLLTRGSLIGDKFIEKLAGGGRHRPPLKHPATMFAAEFRFFISSNGNQFLGDLVFLSSFCFISFCLSSIFRNLIIYSSFLFGFFFC